MWFVVSLHPKQTALYVASQEGHHELVKRLLGAGAGVNILHMPSVSVIMLLLIMLSCKRCVNECVLFSLRVRVLCGLRVSMDTLM